MGKNKRNSRDLQKKIKQKALKAKIKEMRPFMKSLREIDLRKDITPSKAGYINRAFSEYQELTSRPVKIFRSKNKKHLAQAQAYSRHEKGGPKFDVAFVPTADPKAKLQFKGDRLSVKTKYVTETVLFFDLLKLAENPQKEIERTIAGNRKADQFIIMAGKYLFNGGIVRSLIAKKTIDLMSRYSNPEENNFWGNWLFGLVSAEYHNQADFDQYRREYERKKKQTLNDKARVRRAWKLKYGKA